MKRTFDLVCVCMMLPLILAVIGCVALLVRTQLGSPIIFKQQRPGRFGTPFNLYKFRSMTDERDENGNLLPDDIRLTPFGQLLRKYSLDELPQIWNIIKGDISLVGPRPLLMAYLPLYTERQRKRHDVMPGITGWAQINGRNAITWDEKFEFDVWYVENHSFLLDMKILFFTFKKVFKTDEIKHANHVTMPEFKGNLTTQK